MIFVAWLFAWLMAGAIIAGVVTAVDGDGTDDPIFLIGLVLLWPLGLLYLTGCVASAVTRWLCRLLGAKGEEPKR